MRYVARFIGPRGVGIVLEAVLDPRFLWPPTERRLGIKVARCLEHASRWLLRLAAILHGRGGRLDVVGLDDTPMIGDDDMAKANMLGRFSRVGARAGDARREAYARRREKC